MKNKIPGKDDDGPNWSLILGIVAGVVVVGGVCFWLQKRAWKKKNALIDERKRVKEGGTKMPLISDV